MSLTRATLRLQHPSGIDVELDLLDVTVGDIDTMVHTLLSAGYRPRAGAWPTGPTGAPLCLKHGGVEMPTRERQGDVWHSHKVTGPHGEEFYCRGYRHGPADQDGFLSR